MNVSAMGRRSGILVPLFSIPASTSWGIGEIPDLLHLGRWLERAGQRLLQLLPINELPLAESSPYSSLSAMAIDPQFIALGALDDFVAIGGEGALSAGEQATLARLRRASHVRYPEVRSLKLAWLARAWRRFVEAEIAAGTARARAFARFREQESWWLDDYALFRALRASQGERSWTEWPPPLRERDPGALASARRDLADDVGFRSYLQWVAQEQWQSVRAQLGDVALFGDLPFTVGADSADVWSRREEFRLDVSVGVPPDAFSETGQDWGLPAYRWDVCTAAGFPWLRARAARNAALYHGFRVDHLVGFYRTYYRTAPGTLGSFTPESEHDQTALGERVLEVFRSAGAFVIAEDLGTVPDFVRASLTRMGVPGYKVFRWEREWHVAGQPFVDPVRYPAVSVATSGTHDTEPAAVWWAEAPTDERRAVLEIPSVRDRLPAEDRERALSSQEWFPALANAVIETLIASGSDILILPMQDVFGWPDRVNRPATVNERNWTWRLPWAVDQWEDGAGAMDVTERLRTWTRAHAR